MKVVVHQSPIRPWKRLRNSGYQFVLALRWNGCSILKSCCFQKAWFICFEPIGLMKALTCIFWFSINENQQKQQIKFSLVKRVFSFLGTFHIVFVSELTREYVKSTNFWKLINVHQVWCGFISSNEDEH